MDWITKASVDSLVQFSELVAGASAPREVLPLLAESAVNTMGADAAAIFEIDRETAELRLAASTNAPACVSQVRTETGFISSDLTTDLLKLCNGQFKHAHPFPLVSNRDLFGVLVLLFRGTTSLSEGQIALLQAMVHVAAIALGKTDQYTKLRKAYSDLQASQEVLARTEKLRALGQMSASISHDLKNLLSPLFLQVALLRRLTDGTAPSMKIIEGLDRSLKRGIETVERLRDFSRQGPEQDDAEDVSLNQLIEEAVEIAKPRITGRVSVRLDLEKTLPEVHLRPSDFVSAIVNLVFNAIDALGGNGIITISSGADDGGAWVKVSDNGPGMPDSVKKRLFEPFFTTKGKEGTGLGLAMVYALVQRYGGQIKVDTALGQGTAFTLWFPSAGEYKKELRL